MRSVEALPKAHNHIHLDGAMRRETLNELSQERGLGVPAITGYGSFEHFSATIQAVQALLCTPEVVRRVVSEVVEDGRRDGAVWMELAVWPGALPDVLGSPRQRIELVIESGREAARQLGVGFGLMLSANRDRGPEEALAIAEIAVSLKNSGVVSFGLDGDESCHPPEIFVESFALAKSGGLLATPHAGELAGPSSVRSAIQDLHADRVLHGIRVVEDRELVQELARLDVCLDVCPTSNVMLSVVSSMESHPLKELVDQGVPCSINADDPLLFDTSLLHEYDIARGVLGLDDFALAQIARASIRYSGAPERLKSDTISRINRWLSDEELE